MENIETLIQSNSVESEAQELLVSCEVIDKENSDLKSLMALGLELARKTLENK